MRKKKQCDEFCDVIINTLGGELIPFDGGNFMENGMILWKHGEGIISIIQTIQLKRDKEGNILDPEIVWLSYTENDGTNGWMKGKSDLIVFEGIDDWLIISRLKLLKLANSKLTTTLPTPNPNEAWFRLFQPQRSKSLSMKVNKSFIRHNADKIIITNHFRENYKQK